VNQRGRGDPENTGISELTLGAATDIRGNPALPALPPQRNQHPTLLTFGVPLEAAEHRRDFGIRPVRGIAWMRCVGHQAMDGLLTDPPESREAQGSPKGRPTGVRFLWVLSLSHHKESTSPRATPAPNQPVRSANKTFTSTHPENSATSDARDRSGSTPDETARPPPPTPDGALP
jgi:hypothetical protein